SVNNVHEFIQEIKGIKYSLKKIYAENLLNTNVLTQYTEICAIIKELKAALNERLETLDNNSVSTLDLEYQPSDKKLIQSKDEQIVELLSTLIDPKEIEKLESMLDSMPTENSIQIFLRGKMALAFTYLNGITINKMPNSIQSYLLILKKIQECTTILREFDVKNPITLKYCIYFINEIVRKIFLQMEKEKFTSKATLQLINAIYLIEVFFRDLFPSILIHWHNDFAFKILLKQSNNLVVINDAIMAAEALIKSEEINIQCSYNIHNMFLYHIKQITLELLFEETERFEIDPEFFLRAYRKIIYKTHHSKNKNKQASISETRRILKEIAYTVELFSKITKAINSRKDKEMVLDPAPENFASTRFTQLSKFLGLSITQKDITLPMQKDIAEYKVIFSTHSESDFSRVLNSLRSLNVDAAITPFHLYETSKNFIQLCNKFENHIEQYLNKWFEFYSTKLEESILAPLKDFELFLLDAMAFFHNAIFHLPFEAARFEDCHKSIETFDFSNLKNVFLWNRYLFICIQLCFLYASIYKAPFSKFEFTPKEMGSYFDTLCALFGKTLEPLLNHYPEHTKEILDKIKNDHDDIGLYFEYLQKIMFAFLTLNNLEAQVIFKYSNFLINKLSSFEDFLKDYIEKYKFDDGKYADILILLHEAHVAENMLLNILSDNGRDKDFIFKTDLRNIFYAIDSHSDWPDLIELQSKRMHIILNLYFELLQTKKVSYIDLHHFCSSLSGDYITHTLINFLKTYYPSIEITHKTDFLNTFKNHIFLEITNTYHENIHILERLLKSHDKLLSVLNDFLNDPKIDPESIISLTDIHSKTSILRGLIGEIEKIKEYAKKETLHSEKSSLLNSTLNLSSALSKPSSNAMPEFEVLEASILKVKRYTSSNVDTLIDSILKNELDLIVDDDRLEFSKMKAILLSTYSLCDAMDRPRITNFIIDLNQFFESQLKSLLETTFEEPIDTCQLKSTLPKMSQKQYQALINSCEDLNTYRCELYKIISADPLSSALPSMWNNFKFGMITHLVTMIEAFNMRSCDSTEYSGSMKELFDELVYSLATFLLNYFFKPEERFPVDEIFFERLLNRLHYEVNSLMSNKKPVVINGLNIKSIQEILTTVANGLKKFLNTNDALNEIKISSGDIANLFLFSNTLDDIERYWNKSKLSAIHMAIHLNKETIQKVLFSGELNNQLIEINQLIDDPKQEPTKIYLLVRKFVLLQTSILEIIYHGYIQKWLELFPTKEENILSEPLEKYKKLLISHINTFHKRIFFEEKLDLENLKLYVQKVSAINLSKLNVNEIVSLNISSFICAKLFVLWIVSYNRPSKNPLDITIDETRQYDLALESVFHRTAEILLTSIMNKLENHLLSMQQAPNDSSFIIDYLLDLSNGLSTFALMDHPYILDNESIWIEKYSAIRMPLEIFIEQYKRDPEKIPEIIFLLNNVSNTEHLLFNCIKNAGSRQVPFLSAMLSKTFLERTEHTDIDQSESLENYYARLKNIVDFYFLQLKSQDISELEISLFYAKLLQLHFEDYLIDFLKMESWNITITNDKNFFTATNEILTLKMKDIRRSFSKKNLGAMNKSEIQRMIQDYQLLESVIKNMTELLRSLKNFTNNKTLMSILDQLKNTPPIYKITSSDHQNMYELSQKILTFLTFLNEKLKLIQAQKEFQPPTRLIELMLSENNLQAFQEQMKDIYKDHKKQFEDWTENKFNEWCKELFELDSLNDFKNISHEALLVILDEKIISKVQNFEYCQSILKMWRVLYQLNLKKNILHIDKLNLLINGIFLTLIKELNTLLHMENQLLPIEELFIHFTDPNIIKMHKPILIKAYLYCSKILATQSSTHKLLIYIEMGLKLIQSNKKIDRDEFYEFLSLIPSDPINEDSDIFNRIRILKNEINAKGKNVFYSKHSSALFFKSNVSGEITTIESTLSDVPSSSSATQVVSVVPTPLIQSIQHNAIIELLPSDDSNSIFQSKKPTNIPPQVSLEKDNLIINQPEQLNSTHAGSDDSKLTRYSLQAFIVNRTMNSNYFYNSEAELFVFALAQRDWEMIINLSIRMAATPLFIAKAQARAVHPEETQLSDVIERHMQFVRPYQTQFFNLRHHYFSFVTSNNLYHDLLQQGNTFIKEAEASYQTFLFGNPPIFLGVITLAEQTINDIQSVVLENFHTPFPSRAM
ncbi:MAG: hypothetical protein JSS53_09580, partial [Proteobacteria bacterium]|nr:hypothetical protein [Pseudomonadota bacterium]